MSEFWKSKMRKYFFTFDYNRDGVISKNDLIEIAIQFAKIAKADNQKTEHLKTQLVNVWETWSKKAEIGNRNTITANELIVSFQKQRYDPELMKVYCDMIHALYDTMDINNDGYLQKDEYERIFSQCGVPYTSFVKEAFRAIDVNGDGKLSMEEFLNALFDFLFSDDENSPNAFFFGPLDD